MRTEELTWSAPQRVHLHHALRGRLTTRTIRVSSLDQINLCNEEKFNFGQDSVSLHFSHDVSN